MPSRRRVLGAAAAGIAGIAAWRVVASSEEGAVVAVLRKRLDYLVLDEAGLHAYARDLVASQTMSTGKLRLLDMAGPAYARLDLSGGADPVSAALRHGEERVVSLYLLSSDFFALGADESKPVRYRGYYDPGRQIDPCGNPFAQPVFA